jgi:hypothetical protein
MIFTTSRDGSSLVATWEPSGGRFTLIVDGRVAMRARHLRTDRGAEFSWSRHETPELALRVRKLAEDLECMLAVIVGDGGFDAALDAMVLPDLGGWRCSSCGAPIITPRAPSTVETLECPLCIERRTATERVAIALAIVLAETRITDAIAKEPMITRQTQAEVDQATAQLRQLSARLSSVGAGPADPKGGGWKVP